VVRWGLVNSLPLLADSSAKAPLRHLGLAAQGQDRYALTAVAKARSN
jgi:hypothetical protein